MMIPPDWKLPLKVAEPLQTKHCSFFDAPMGAKVCNCGAKVVHQGMCQKCWDEGKEDVIREFQLMHEQIKSSGEYGISDKEFKAVLGM